MISRGYGDAVTPFSLPFYAIPTAFLTTIKSVLNNSSKKGDSRHPALAALGPWGIEVSGMALADSRGSQGLCRFRPVWTAMGSCFIIHSKRSNPGRATKVEITKKATQLV